MATTKKVGPAPTVRRYGWTETRHDFQSGAKGARRSRRRREAQAWRAEARTK